MRRTRRGDDGQASIELVALLPLMLLTGALVVQLALAGYCLVAAENAARVGARAASLCEDGSAAGQQAPPGWLRDELSVAVGSSGGAARAEARTGVPVLFTSVQLPVTITRDAEFPLTRDC